MDVILLTLTNAIRNNTGRTNGVACICLVGWVLTQGKVQILNVRRKVVDSKASIADRVLWSLQGCRRRQRIKEVLGAARLLSEALKAPGDAHVAMVDGNIAQAVEFAVGANEALKVPGDIRLLLLGVARDQMKTIPDVLLSEIDATIKRMIDSHHNFYEHHVADIVIAYISLRITPEKRPLEATISKITTSLALRISDFATRFIEQATSAENIRNFATLVCSSFMKTMQYLKIFEPVNAHLDGISTSLELAVIDIWLLARQVIVGFILGLRGFDCTRFLVFLDTARALESLDATRKFAMSCGGRGLETDAFKHRQHLLSFVCIPLLKEARIELFDRLHQMLSSGIWLNCEVEGGLEDPRGALNGGFSIARVGLEWARQESMMIDGRHCHLGVISVLKGASTLVATCAINFIQRVTLELAPAAIILEGVTLHVLEVLFGLLEHYLAAAATEYFPTGVDVVPPCSCASAQLSALLGSITRKIAKNASRLNRIRGAVVVAESLLYAGETILNAASTILSYETRINKYVSAKRRLQTYVRTASELRTSMFRVIGSSLVDARNITNIILGLDSAVWVSSILREECNNYVHVIVKKLSSLWLCLDNRKIDVLCSDDVKELIWTNAVQATFEALVDGFALVKTCSAAGRALMSMDLHVLQFTLENVHRASPSRGAAYVDSYIKAWYFDHRDLSAWITQNVHNYHKKHLDALLAKSGSTPQLKWQEAGD
eukprot:CAMPEP_0119265902 /NCGR_PEP_ID=MMETSP1329-20130426/4566_1 /TAXON_ID=114041 /ORGANISM="Genus nov. species nov., Strain RCC1024" /LENGTH=720 /DNA_ID=CAMNT_0007265759 /DNA_START=435 /DNA_END=2597 /DNA_ORIENTATION=+